jgi:hypothetical protein
MPTIADFDYFGDVNEMILDAMLAVKTRQPYFFNKALEIAVIAIAQNFGKITV